MPAIGVPSASFMPCSRMKQVHEIPRWQSSRSLQCNPAWPTPYKINHHPLPTPVRKVAKTVRRAHDSTAHVFKATSDAKQRVGARRSCVFGSRPGTNPCRTVHTAVASLGMPKSDTAPKRKTDFTKKT